MKRAFLVLAVLAVASGAALTAQQPAPAGQAQEAFVPVSQLPQGEQLPAAPLLIGAYSFVWVALMVYVWLLWRRLAKVERELADLHQRVQKR